MSFSNYLKGMVNKMKKTFVTPQVELITFEAMDVLTTSILASGTEGTAIKGIDCSNIFE